MAAGFTMLLAKIAAALGWIGELFVKVFAALWDMVCDAWCWPFEQALKIAVSAVNSLELGALQGSLQSWGSLPGDVLNVLGLLGVGQALSIIGAAIGIRLALQLIPFTRLGS